jgi:hypothetical protein
MVGASFVTAVAEVIRSKKGITAVGNAQVDTAQSKFGGASALFDGTGDYLLIDSTNSSSLNFGTNDFTLEFFSRATVRDQFHTIIANNKSSWTAGSVTLLGGSGSTSTTALRLAANSFNSGGAGIVFDNQAMTTGVWYHYAIVRSGNNFTMFRDGTSVSTGTFAGAINLGEDGTRIGYTRWDGDVSTWDGHIDEFRISNNARYTTTFTPTTTPFVNDANTLLLIHADGTDATTFFEDDNGVRAPKAIIANVNAQVSTAQSKFGGTSLLFDGTTDTRIIVIDSISETGAYTIEFWFRKTANAGDLFYVQTETTGRGVMYIGATGNILYDTYSTGTPDFNNTGTEIATGLSNSVWYHIAYVREASNTVKVYLDGVLKQTSSSNVNLPTGGIWFGSRGYIGNIDEIRISNSARYTAAFTPSTTPFVNDANTTLLIHGDGTNGSKVIRDDNGIGRSPKGISALGNAQISTAQSKFGGASALFDGTGDRLTVNSTGDFGFTGDFTLEGWFRASSFGNQFFLFDFRLSADGSVVKPTLYYTPSSGGSIRYFVNGSDRIQSTAFASTTNTWYHIALCKSGTSTKLFINGTQDGSTYTDTNTYVNSNCEIGDYAGGGYGLNGHADEIRFSNSARYTANFTAPTTLFQNDANTLLLLHMDGTNASTVFVDDNGTRPI